MIRDERRPTTQERRQPAEEVRMKRGREGGEFLEEEGMVDGVERLREIESGGDGAKRRFRLIEAEGDFGDEWEESCGAGVTGREAVLVRGARERLEKERTDEALEDFGGGTQEGDGTVRGGEGRGFSGVWGQG